MTNPDELAYMPIAEIAPHIEQKRLSPVEIAEAVLSRIERLNPALNAYYTIYADELRAAALSAEREIARGNYRGPLHGIPIGIKDIYEYGRTSAALNRLRATSRNTRRARLPNCSRTAP
jgi:aspartyl-tRNA(Asn)/glutamyl-tRNA(Gln) amidotransferase subunit A